MEHSSRSSTSTETIVYKGKDGDYVALITAVYSAARARDIESELAMTISKRMIELDYVFDKHTSVMMHLLGTPRALTVKGLRSDPVIQPMAISIVWKKRYGLFTENT